MPGKIDSRLAAFGNPAQPQREERFSISEHGLTQLSLNYMLADVQVAAAETGDEILVRCYGDATLLDMFEFDRISNRLVVFGELPYASQSKAEKRPVQLSGIRIGGNVNISVTGDRSVAAMAVGKVDVSGSEPIIDGVPASQLNTQPESQRDHRNATVIANGRQLDMSRKLLIVVVVPKSMRLRVVDVYGTLELVGEFDTQPEIRHNKYLTVE